MSIKDLKIGESVYVQSYKHSGSLHRTWSKAQVIDVKDDFVVVVTDHSWVVEADGRRWLTKEPAICFYYTKRWYNIISMVRKTGIYYYCNLASPSLYDGEAIKNIDYDLDVKLYPDGYYEILDEDEFEQHSKQMNYSTDIINIVEGQMKELIRRMEACEEPFNNETIRKYYKEYQKNFRF